MKVSLLSYTPNADRILLFSKQTRLNMSPDSFQKVLNMKDDEVEKELKYVFGTIASSWEFVDYTFLITGVSRILTHELVRTRQASYAQQSTRAVDMNDFECVEPDMNTNKENAIMIYSSCINDIRESYKALTNLGVNIQEARGVLPMNIATNIMMKINLRALSHLMNDRLCIRAAGEYQKVADEMKKRILEVHPWAKPVLQVNCVQYGFCQFRNFKDCPMKTNGFIKDHDPDSLENEWKKIRTSVQPKVGK